MNGTLLKTHMPIILARARKPKQNAATTKYGAATADVTWAKGKKGITTGAA
jgi:hypothetical protein